MSSRWGRDETYRWPSDKPVWTLTVLVLTVLAMAGTAVYQYQRQWTFLQQTYLKTYISTERSWLKSAPYPILYRVEGKQQRAAVDDDLSDPAVVSGKVKLQWERGVYNNAELARWLETAIYGGESPWAKLWEWVWKVGALVFGVGFLFSAPRDYQRQRIRKYGRRTKGPELVTAAQFNGANHSDGIGFLSKERRTGKERDSESGLDEFGARYYSSALGRFVSADWSATPTPVPYADFANPQSLNLYVYVKNNPLNFTDLDGHDDSTTEKVFKAIDFVFGVVRGFAASVVKS